MRKSTQLFFQITLRHWKIQELIELKKHALIDILIISICGAICGAKTWVDIEDFGKSKQEWFSTFLNLVNRIPSHDTFRRLFLLLNQNEFSKVFMDWVKDLRKILN